MTPSPTSGGFDFKPAPEPDVSDAPHDTDAGVNDGASPPPPPGSDWKRPGGQLGEIHDAIELMLGGVALAFYTAGDFHCYTVLAERGPIVAQTWTDAARRSPQVKKALLRLLEGGIWGQVIFASASLAIPIMAHHNMWPFPNPWAILQTTPADHNPLAAAAAAAWADGEADATAAAEETADIAEQQRRAAEARRKQQ